MNPHSFSEGALKKLIVVGKVVHKSQLLFLLIVVCVPSLCFYEVRIKTSIPYTWKTKERLREPWYKSKSQSQKIFYYGRMALSRAKMAHLALFVYIYGKKEREESRKRQRENLKL